jgi:hypothetical protein
MINIYAVGALEWGLFSWLMLLIGLVVLTGVIVLWQLLGSNPKHGEIDDAHQGMSDISWLTGE